MVWLQVMKGLSQKDKIKSANPIKDAKEPSKPLKVEMKVPLLIEYHMKSGRWACQK